MRPSIDLEIETLLRDRPKRVAWRPALAWLALLVLLVVGGQARRSEEGREFRRFLHSRSLERAKFPSGDAVNIFTQLGLLHPTPPRDHEPLTPGRNHYGSFRLSLDGMPEDEVASTLLVDPSLVRGELPVVSLLADTKKLEWLHTNRLERGKEYEAPGFFALIEEGEVAFASKVDFRLHGGWTRRVPMASSYRVYFRRGNGATGFPARLLPGYQGPDPQRLIVRFNGAADPHGREWHFTGPLAYDIARQAGLPAPVTRPVLFFVNGEYRGVRALTEHLAVRTFKQKLGHDQFVLVDTKPSFQKAPLAKHGDIRIYEQMSRDLLAHRPITAARASADIDLDNLSRWWATVLFCGTEDRFQGPAVLDLTSPDNRWFWTAWDIDRSFGRGSLPPEPWWKIDSFDSAFHRRELRIELLRRLLAEDPAFQSQFGRVFDEVMNHRLTAAFLAERTDHYAGLVETANLPHSAAERLREVASGAEARQLRVRELLDLYWQVGKSYPVEVNAPPGQTFEVDGFAKTDSYRGLYFHGQPFRLSLPGIEQIVVNGEALSAPGGKLEIPVDRPLSVRW